MASEIRVNTINNRSGLGTISITNSGAVFSGIITATSIDTSSTSAFSSDVSIADKIIHTGDTNTAIRFPANDTFAVETGGSEALRIDSSQRLLVGRNTSPGNGAQYSRIAIQGFIGSDTGGGDLALMRGEAAADMTNLDDIGVIRFSDSGGNRFAFIRARVDGAPSVSNFPGRLEFMTNPGGGETDAEIRMAIKSDGKVGIGTANPSQKLNVSGNIMLDGSDQYCYLSNVGTFNSGIYVRGRTATSELRSHSTGIFTWEVTGNEKMRITSDGKIGINNNNPSTNIHIIDGAPAIRLKATNLTQRDYDIKTDGNEIYIEGVGGSSGSLAVGENGVYPFRVDMGSGDAKFYLNGSGNVELAGNIQFASGKGIDFSATSDVAGMTSELLDDYEEGTWTPVLGASGTNFDSVSYQVRSGTYTKIGNLVFLRCNFYTNSVTKGSASGNVRITNLPFTSTSIAAACLNDVRIWDGNPSTGASITGSQILLFKRSTFNGDDTPLQVSDVRATGVGNLCQFSGCYHVS